jgi:beta-lactamase superfamily II metal-dependent hydrolase
MPYSRKTLKQLTPSDEPKSGVTVRMYNPGFGDCMLLTFRASDGSNRYMLIDCGVHHGYPNGKRRMQLVASDIAKVTDNHLHVVAVTHEHTDHLYGFKYARDVFDNIKIDNLWLAWTEDPTDPVANQLKYHIKKQVEELTMAVNRLAPMDQQLAGSLQGILDFELAASSGEAKLSELDYLRTKSIKKPQQSSDYLRPGDEPLTMPDVKGVKVYVLGPPRDVSYIRIIEQESEMYPEFAAINQSQAFSAALKSGLPGISEIDDLIIKRSCPFHERYKINPEKAADKSFFKKHYGFTEERKHGPEWRRIDADWLATSEELALRINSMTNNTSLVLAIELTESPLKKVLLFVGDAQVGNWQSWQKVEWVTGTQEKDKISGEDLLRRTVFYKVGHHGSRNATLCRKGLEIMDDARLVAMIPVDQKWANDEMGWEHPAEKLLDRLEEKAKGRVLRTDTICSMPGTLQKPVTIDKSDWQAFMDRLDWDRSSDNLWIQYTVEG